MGESDANSVTNLDGRFHHLDNAYVAGPALFPSIGSANPSLTALALGRRTASAIVDRLARKWRRTSRPCSMARSNGWKMAGPGKFAVIGNAVLESDGGPGTPLVLAKGVCRLRASPWIGG
jgi:hypothetical protein